MRTTALLLSIVTLAACSNPRGLIQAVDPLNGATLVASDIKPRIELTGSAGIDALYKKVVLYEVTGGAKLTVGGEVEVSGSTLTYLPKNPLRANAEFSLDISDKAISGDDFDKVDVSESPDETLGTKFGSQLIYRLSLSTRSCPRVRAAYLEQQGSSTRISIRFSQKMDHTATGAAIQLLDNNFKNPQAISKAVWTDSDFTSLYVDTSKALASDSIYVLKVASTAKAADQTGLDGNRNWKCGETKDDFFMKFTGAQTVIFTRLQTDVPSKAP